MNQHLKIAAVGLFAFALTACSGVGGSLPGPTQNAPSQSQSISNGPGIDISHAHIMRTRFSQNVIPNLPHLTYRNGAIDRTPAIYVVYWGFNVSGSDPSGEQAYMTSFLNGVGGSKWIATDKQYYQIVGGVKQHIQNPIGQLKGTWVDPSSVPNSPTQAQVETEAAAAEAHFGYNKYASYVVATPHGHNTPGFGSQFCAFHWQKATGGGTVAYTDLPYMTDAGGNCGANILNPGPAGLLDGVSIVEGHELSETQTDPFPFSGWYDNANGEIGDICAWINIQNTVLSTGTFATQPLWSNKAGACVQHTP
jgi:hypothetical protein